MNSPTLKFDSDLPEPHLTRTLLDFYSKSVTVYLSCVFPLVSLQLSALLSTDATPTAIGWLRLLSYTISPNMAAQMGSTRSLLTTPQGGALESENQKLINSAGVCTPNRKSGREIRALVLIGR